MRLKELPDEPRYLLGYLVEVRPCGFGVLVQRNPLLDTGNRGKRKGDRFNLQPQQLFDKLASNTRSKQHA